MAISLEETTKEKTKEKKSGLPFWLVWILFVAIIIGFVVYFIFIKKTTEQETVYYTTSQEALSKEELIKFQEIIVTVQKPPIVNLHQMIPPSFFSSPPKSKIGTRSNPFK